MARGGPNDSGPCHPEGPRQAQALVIPRSRRPRRRGRGIRRTAGGRRILPRPARPKLVRMTDGVPSRGRRRPPVHLRLRQESPQESPDLVGRARRSQLPQPRQRKRQLVRRHPRDLPDGDLRVPRLVDRLRRVLQLLEQLLPWPYPRKQDVDLPRLPVTPKASAPGPPRPPPPARSTAKATPRAGRGPPCTEPAPTAPPARAATAQSAPPAALRADSYLARTSAGKRRPGSGANRGSPGWGREGCYFFDGPGRTMKRWVKSASTESASRMPSLSITTKLTQSTKL